MTPVPTEPSEPTLVAHGRAGRGPGWPGRPGQSGGVGKVAARVPLRTQLVAAILLLGAVAMVLFGFAGAARLRSTLQGGLDGRLSSLAAELSGPGGGPGTFGGGGGGGGRRGAFSDNSTWEATVNNAGRYLNANADPTTTAFPGFVIGKTTQTGPALPTVTAAFAASRSGLFTVTATGGGARWRVLLVPVTVDETVPGTLVVAVTQESVDDPVSALTRIDLITGAAVLVLLGVAAWLVVRASLTPLRGVERTAAAIAGGDLTRRVPVVSTRTEVGRLGTALNTMLGHIEAAFRSQAASEVAANTTADQMRRFAADASHELRTPLTSIRGFAELSRSGMVPPGADTDRVMARIESEAIRMTGLVEDLLLLARLDQQRPLDRQPVDLLAIAADAVHDAAVIGPDHPTTLTGPAPGTPAAVVTGDDARLRQVVTVLVANALHHTPPATPVEVRVTTTAVSATLAVIDQGPGLDPADADQVFDRFYRADASRTRTGTSRTQGGGSGLGLSIVAALVHAHGGTVTVHTTPGAGATFAVTLPLTTTSGVDPRTPDRAIPAGR